MNLPQSPQALRLYCILMDIENQKLQEQLRAQKKAQQHFWRWIADKRNYCIWKVRTGKI